MGLHPPREDFPLKRFSLLAAGLLGAAALLPIGDYRSANALSNCSVGDTSIDGEEGNFLGIINDYRSRNGLATLTISTSLSRAAVWMAADMGEKNYFGHTDSLGRSPWTRIVDCGYPIAGGENLAAGTYRDTAASAFELFRNSPTHNENMLVADYRQIGIARVFVAGSKYGWYWATTFGTLGDAPAPAPPPPPPPAAKPEAAPAPVQLQRQAPAPQVAAAPAVEAEVEPPAPLVVAADPEVAKEHGVRLATVLFAGKPHESRFTLRGVIRFPNRVAAAVFERMREASGPAGSKFGLSR